MTETTRSTRIHRRGIAALLVVPALIVTLAACAPAPGGSMQGGSGGTAQESDAGSGDLTLTDWQLKYAECMRGEGIDMPDPQGPGQGVALSPSTDQSAVMAAADKCRSELGDPPPMSKEEEEAANQQFLEWGRQIAACYRENGYDVPDPKAGETPKFPEDAPAEVSEECGGGAGSVTTRTEG